MLCGCLALLHSARVLKDRHPPPVAGVVVPPAAPVCAVTCPSSATFAPKSASTTDDLPAPRRPTSTSAGGRLSSRSVRSVAMRARTSLAMSRGSRSRRSSIRSIARARALSGSSLADIDGPPCHRFMPAPCRTCRLRVFRQARNLFLIKVSASCGTTSQTTRSTTSRESASTASTC